MDQTVQSQLTIPREPLLANFTDMRFMPRVHSRVVFETLFNSVSLTADVASVRLVSSMYGAMLIELLSRSKFLQTYLTAVWFLISVE